MADPTWDPDNTLTLEQLIATLKRNFTLGVIVEEWVGPDDRNSLGHVIQVKKRKTSWDSAKKAHLLCKLKNHCVQLTSGLLVLIQLLHYIQKQHSFFFGQIKFGSTGDQPYSETPPTVSVFWI